jgi:F1F0 ATPase subunit 2
MSAAVMPHDFLFIAGMAGWFVAGGLLGLAHFLSLRWNVRRLVAGRALASLGLQVLRLCLTGTAMTLTVRLFGAGPLLAGALGLIAARTGVLRLEVR